MSGEKRLQLRAKIEVCAEEAIPVELPAGLEGVHVFEDEFPEPLLSLCIINHVVGHGLLPGRPVAIRGAC
jgi:hypothetical protein